MTAWPLSLNSTEADKCPVYRRVKRPVDPTGAEAKVQIKHHS